MNMNGWRLDGRHRWSFFLDGPYPMTTGYYQQANNWFYRAAFRCRVCKAVFA